MKKRFYAGDRTREKVDSGDIEFEINIVNFKGDQALDIKPLLIEFNLYGDIFNSVLKADFVIKDGLGLIERFPIVGDEVIVLKYKTAGEREFQTFILSVYKISNRVAIEERSHAYIIEGISREGIVNQQTIVDRAYTNQSIGSIVEKVFDESFKLNRKKELIVEPEPGGLHSFIAPKTTPFEFINMLASEARSTFYPNDTTYIFYEDAFNFHFTTLGYLFENVPIESYYLQDPSVEDLRDGKDEIKKHQTIIDMSFDANFDTLRGLNSGLYKNNIQTIDTILKKYQSSDFSYNTKFDDMPHLGLNPNKVISEKGFIGTSGSPTHQRFLSSRLTSSTYSEESYLNEKVTNTTDPYLYSPRTRHNFIGSGTSALNNFAQYTLNVVVPGDSYIQPGYLVNIFIPQNSDVQDDFQKYLKLYGQIEPMFLVTAVKHNYKAETGKYITVMNVTKESFATTIKSEYESKDRSNEI